MEALGATDTSDTVFAASCYCPITPITDLDHAGMAYEWEFLGVNEYRRAHMRRDEGGRPAFSAEDGSLTEGQIRVSREEATLFPAYLNSLGLRDAGGAPLTLDERGEGPFKKYVEGRVLATAQCALGGGADLAAVAWLTVESSIAAMDFSAYVRGITRMKTPPAFDDLGLKSPENNLFGTDGIEACHFTPYRRSHSLAGGTMADPRTVRMLNPPYYLEDAQAVKAPHWRIRHGKRDRDTSLAVSSILTLKLQNLGCSVDYHVPWDTPTPGTTAWMSCFAWIDAICM